jgi:ankyrin repeat protein
LLAAGAAVDARDKKDLTPYLVCCSTGRMDIMSILLSAGADPTVTNAQGQTAHDIGVFFNRPEIVRHCGADSPAKRFA